MDAKELTEIEETVKSFLIVGETFDQMYSFKELRRRNIFIAIVFLLSTIYSILQAVSVGVYWYFLSFSFLFGTIYYLIISRISVIYTITKYRIIRFERNVISSFIFKNSRLLGFTDLHYEHVESIHIGPPPLKIPLIYISVFGIALGWLIFESIKNISLTPSNLNFYRLIAGMIIIGSIINLFFTLPIGGVRLEVKSVSGTSMLFPESNTPERFISQLLVNCRTFLSYGTE